jgi:hypothetical protein
MAVSAALEYRLSKAWSLQLAAGGIFSGQLDGVRTGAGGVGSFGASWLALDQGKYTPFLQLSGSLAFSAVQATPTTYLALDIRLGVVAGYTFFDRLTPYLTARAFGGPVFWSGAVGTDLYHYQFGVGLVVGLPWGLDLSAEVVPLGEQRLTAGIGISF